MSKINDFEEAMKDIYEHKDEQALRELDALYNEIESLKAENELLSKRFNDINVDCVEIARQLKDAEKVIEFYGDINNYMDTDLLGLDGPIILNDCEIGDNIKFSDHLTVGGKTAREYLAKYKGASNEPTK